MGPDDDDIDAALRGDYPGSGAYAAGEDFLRWLSVITFIAVLGLLVFVYAIMA